MNGTLKIELIEEQLRKDQNRMYRLAYSYVHNPDDAMDIVQEAAYKTLRARERIHSPEYLSTWIYRVVVNTALDFLRSNKREAPFEEVLAGSYEDAYQRLDVWEALDVLDEKSRAVVILRFFEDRKLAEIAQILGEKESTVKTRLYRALSKMKIEVSEGSTAL